MKRDNVDKGGGEYNKVVSRRSSATIQKKGWTLVV
jgi:hypothetical protein